jgi:hypothetical protein
VKKAKAKKVIALSRKEKKRDRTLPNQAKRDRSPEKIELMQRTDNRDLK